MLTASATCSAQLPTSGPLQLKAALAYSYPPPQLAAIQLSQAMPDWPSNTWCAWAPITKPHCSTSHDQLYAPAFAHMHWATCVC